MTTREDIAKSEIKIKVQLDSKIWKEYQDKAFTILKENLQLKGFRKGKIPTDVAKKNISQTQVFKKAIDDNIKTMAEDANKKITENDKVIAGPFFHVSELTEEKATVVFSYALYPEIDIKNYKNLDIKFNDPTIDKKDVDAELERIRERLSIWNIIDEKIKSGNKAKFDFEGFVDNKPFQGGKAENYELIIGSKRFIPGFEKGMIGLKKGDEHSVKVKFPKEYHDAKMADKDAVFKVKIHEVYEKTVPKLDDTLALESNIPDVKTLIELKEFLKTTLKEGKLISLKNDFKKVAFSLFKKDLDILIPEPLINKEVERQVKDFEDNLKRQGTNFKEYQEKNNINPKDLIDNFKAEANNRLLDSFIFADIAGKEKLNVTEEEYENLYKKLAKIYSQDIESVKKAITKGQLQVQMLNDKVIDTLIKNRKK